MMRPIKIGKENSEYQIIQSLKKNREKRNKENEIFIEGIECIKQAITSKLEISRIIVKNTDTLSGWGKDVIKNYDNIKIIEMTDELYNGLADKDEPSEMLITAKIKRYSIDDVISQKPFIILFDRPSDYGNFGSIIRSANAFGADAIFVVGHGVDFYEPKVIRASLGSIFFSKIIHIESMEILKDYVKNQKKLNNMEVIGTDSSGSLSLGNEKIKKPVMLIMGNESRGMSIGLKELCDKIIKIPMDGNVNSLNVSCAASILMWEIYKNEI